jgi:methionyl-tRNA formyltransferase
MPQRNSAAIRVLFLVGTKRGYLSLSAAIKHGMPVCGVICFRQDAHERERYESQIEAIARDNDIPFFETRNLKERNYAEIIHGTLKPDLAFLIGVRVLVPVGIYAPIRLGALAAHDSLLPSYRGFAPLNWSLINGERQTGVTLFRLSEGVDDGPIVGQRAIPVAPNETAPQVYEKICTATIELVLDAYDRASQGELNAIDQEPDKASYASARTPNDGAIDWNSTTLGIYNQVRALTFPYPGAYTFHKGKKLTIWKAEPAPSPVNYVGRIPGRIVGINVASGSVDVLTRDGILRLFEVELEGSQPTVASDILVSIRDSLGIDIGDLMRRLAKLEAAVEGLSKSRNDQSNCS